MGKRILHIDNMVCDRCKMVVRSILEGLGWEVKKVDLGTVMGSMPVGFDLVNDLAPALRKVGFALTTEGSLSVRLKLLNKC